MGQVTEWVQGLIGERDSRPALVAVRPVALPIHVGWMRGYAVSICIAAVEIISDVRKDDCAVGSGTTDCA